MQRGQAFLRIRDDSNYKKNKCIGDIKKIKC